MCDYPHCGQRGLFIEMAPRNEIVSASLLQRVSPLYSTFQPYICSATKDWISVFFVYFAVFAVLLLLLDRTSPFGHDLFQSFLPFSASSQCLFESLYRLRQRQNLLFMETGKNQGLTAISPIAGF